MESELVFSLQQCDSENGKQTSDNTGFHGVWLSFLWFPRAGLGQDSKIRDFKLFQHPYSTAGKTPDLNHTVLLNTSGLFFLPEGTLLWNSTKHLYSLESLWQVCDFPMAA